jgi:hypothetical protein
VKTRFQNLGFQILLVPLQDGFWRWGNTSQYLFKCPSGDGACGGGLYKLNPVDP